MQRGGALVDRVFHGEACCVIADQIVKMVPAAERLVDQMPLVHFPQRRPGRPDVCAAERAAAYESKSAPGCAPTKR